MKSRFQGLSAPRIFYILLSKDCPDASEKDGHFDLLPGISFGAAAREIQNALFALPNFFEFPTHLLSEFELLEDFSTSLATAGPSLADIGE